MNSELGPGSTNAFAAAVNWIETTLLGGLATAVAIIVIGAIGLLMFSGRVPTRRAIEAVLGCFILFGASTIARGIMQAVNGSGSETASVAVLPPPPPPEAPVQKLPAQPYDPYAGAALPPRQ